MLNPLLTTDFYKISHKNCYPEGMSYLYSTWTARKSLKADFDSVVFFGIQYVIKTKIIDFFNSNFFNLPLSEVVENYKTVITASLGIKEPDTSHIEKLHTLGYLPIKISALPEGSIVPIQVPMLTIENTHPEFYWLVGYLETLLSCELWNPITTATIAKKYKDIFDRYSTQTVGNTGFVPFQGHDFSMRGMSSLSSAVSGGMGHLLSFIGTDTIPAIQAVSDYYNTPLTELIGTSVPATEHSVQSAFNDDKGYFLNVITKSYPEGIVSVVSDGFDFWNVITNILPDIKDVILKRNGKVVIRPDSGDPVKIICGDSEAKESTPEHKGLIECLWDTFGGTVNQLGYKLLNEKIGAIYGDSITIERATAILEGLKLKGFASCNIVFGIGSFTYQYNTRDTFGFAMKATHCIIDGKERQIFKNPKTGGDKKSQKGIVRVFKEQDTLVYEDGLYLNNTEDNLLDCIFKDGQLLKDVKFADIKAKLEMKGIVL